MKSEKFDKTDKLYADFKAMSLKRQNALLRSTDNVQQMRQTIKEVNDENHRLKEQLAGFLTEIEPIKEQSDQASIQSADQSDSLYQMLQECMTENQKLKAENEQLKNEKKEYLNNLAREKDTSAKITQEVVKYLAPNQSNMQSSMTQVPQLQIGNMPMYPQYQAQPMHFNPYGMQPSIPNPYQQYLAYQPQQYPIYEDLKQNRQQNMETVWHASSQKLSANVRPSRNTQSSTTLPDVALQAVSKTKPEKSTRVPRYSSNSNRTGNSYERLDHINQKAKRDIEEINRQINRYKKLNRSQR